MHLFARIFQALNEREVKYVLVGGLAVVMHGHPRLTMDVDLVVALDEENARRAIDALSSIGLHPRIPVDASLFADAPTRKEWSQSKNMLVFSMSDPANPMIAVDLFIEPPLPFEQLEKNAAWQELDGIQVLLCSREDLIALKRISARPEDLADIRALGEEP